MTLNIPLILRAVVEDYDLPRDGDHGIAHWARVMENGLRLAGETGANVEVVRLFAVLHDSRRVSEVTDPDHGPRAGEFASSLRGRLFDLLDHEFRLLQRACSGQTHERTHPDVTIQTCWDTDRLDLVRDTLLAMSFPAAIEVSQLYHAPWIDSIRRTTVGGLVLGHGFLWSDLACYAVGVGTGMLVELTGLHDGSAPGTRRRCT